MASRMSKESREFYQLSAMFFYPDLIDAYSPEDFIYTDYKKIMEAMVYLRDNGEEVSPGQVLLSLHLRPIEVLEGDYKQTIANIVYSAIDPQAEIIRKQMLAAHNFLAKGCGGKILSVNDNIEKKSIRVVKDFLSADFKADPENER